MQRLSPNVFVSPPFPRVPHHILRPLSHPVPSPFAKALSKFDIQLLHNAAEIAASARLFAQRIIERTANQDKVKQYLEKLVTEEYVDSLRQIISVGSPDTVYKSRRLYIDYLIHHPLTTHAADLMVGAYLVSRSAYPSGVGFMGFPRATCTSVNETVAHGIPDLRPLETGDIVNVDLTCYLDGFFGDCSATFIYGASETETSALVAAPNALVRKTIESLHENMSLFDLAALMDEEREKIGNFKCVEYFCGHSIGRHLHEKPNIFHTLEGLSEDVKQSLRNERLFRGQVLTIEPILVAKEGETKGKLWPDGWTWVTVDGSWTAQHEDMVFLGEDGPEVLTVPDDENVGL
jgi:methionine aminopeptidase type I